MLLQKVNARFYSYFDKGTGMLFTLKYGDRGVLGRGKAWFLSVTYDGAKQSIATFSVVDDGNNTYKEDYMCMLWDQSSVLYAAEEMVQNMTGNKA